MTPIIARDALMPQEAPLVRELLREYQQGLGISLCFQNFEAELAELPGSYVRPAGCLLLAIASAKLVGCVAVRPIEPGICELKRLFVKPAYRGMGVGRVLTTEAIARATNYGHHFMRLDTLSTMQAARELYRSLAFHEISSYNSHPVEGTFFMELDLRSQGG
jgi:putative acetyltransferase